MRITKYGHACLLVEEGSAKLLLDPGSFSDGLDALAGLTAVLYTHAHGDHFDADKLATLKQNNPEVKLVADEATAKVLADRGETVQTVHEGDEFELGGVKVRAIGSQHAVIHASIPVVPNVGYMIADRFFFPGDALTVPKEPVEILALPVEAPWTKVGEVIDYLWAVAPKLALPAHESVSAMPQMQYQMVSRAAADRGIEWKTPANGQPLEV